MRFTSAVLTAALVPCVAIEANAQTPDFGTPPSGRIPILFNDRHVYAKPDQLRQGRLLAALVRGNEILVPLRSMFEQAGASVMYDRESRSTIVRKPGTTIEVTVGVPEVRINGEVRPLDVPPIAFGDDILVPVRVIAEALGAYVEYEPNIRAVIVRYVPQNVPTPEAVKLQRVPAEGGASRPTVPPGPPIPVGTPPPETYLVADVAVAPKVANAFSPHVTGATAQSFDLRGATEFSLLDVPLELDGEYARYAYPHPNGFVTTLGALGNTFVPAFEARDTEFDVHFGAQVNPKKVYVSAGYLSFGNEYGYPRIGGLGLGLEKLPVLSDRLSYDASVFFYPNVSGVCSLAACPQGPYDVSYRFLTFAAGVTYTLGPVFLEAGYRGDRGMKKVSAPVGVSHDGPYVGLGLHL